MTEVAADAVKNGDDVTELVELQASKLAAVGSPANGTPWLLLKAQDGTAEEAGSAEPAAKAGEPHDEDTDSGEADGQQERMTDETAKGEAEEIEDELTKSAHAEGAYCGEEACERCVIKDAGGIRLRPGIASMTKAAQQSRAYWEQVTKKDVDPDVGGGVDRDKIAAEDFAGKDRSFPIVTPADVSDAASSIGRAGEENYSADQLKANIIEIAQRKGPKFVSELPEKWREELDAKKGQVQDALAGTKAPEAAGVIPSGRSGLAGPATGAPKDKGSTVAADHKPSSRSGMTTPLNGGESAYEIPAEQCLGLINPAPSAPEVVKAGMLAQLSGAMSELEAQRQARKDGNYLSIPGPAAEQAQAPGSTPWESYDAATLDQVAAVLAACCNAVEAICTREQIEALTGDTGDMQDAWDLQDAAGCLDSAMGIVARLAYAEGAQKSEDGESAVEKAYRRLRAGDEKALRDAHAALSNVLAEHDRAKSKGEDVEAGQDEPSEGDKIQMELTKEELAEAIDASVSKAVKAEVSKQARKAAKAAKKARKAAKAEAKKNANNGGDITVQQMKDGVNGQADADDVNVAGGAVQDRFVNKSEADEADPMAQALKEQLEAATEAITEQGETLKSLGEQFQKFAKRPRTGGPILDGQARGTFPAAETRLGDGSASEGDTAQLIKSLQERYEAESEPLRKQDLGFQLTQLRLRQAHEHGQI
jgi:hypothetical protein